MVRLRGPVRFRRAVKLGIPVRFCGGVWLRIPVRLRVMVRFGSTRGFRGTPRIRLTRSPPGITPQATWDNPQATWDNPQA
jgi:hypothetical protein